MYTQKTKQKIIDYLKKIDKISANKLQYIGQNKKQIHNKNLLQILTDLQKEKLIEINEHEMNKKMYRTIKYTEEVK
jgi:predicted ArsR family transcriptional regulator